MKRYEFIDALRGFALIGVIIVNAGTINSPFWMESSDFAFKSFPLDFFVTKWSLLFLVEKFYPIFALLFGLSAALMLGRGSDKIFLKRLFFLAIFGFLHITLFFWGDVLALYALMGVLLWAMSKLDRRGILIGACILLLATVIMNGLIQLLGLPEDDYSDLMLSPYATGSFVEIVQQRLSDYYEWYFWGFFQTESLMAAFDYGIYYTELLAFMFLGSWMGHYKRHFSEFPRHIPLLIKAALVSFAGVCVFQVARHFSPEWMDVFSPLEKIFFVALYSSIFCLFYLKCLGANWQRAFSSVGRMTLSWYLGFSVLMSFLLHGNGLGYYGSIGPAWCMGVAIFWLILCFLVSPLWLKKFPQGPVERFWRGLAS